MTQNRQGSRPATSHRAQRRPDARGAGLAGLLAVAALVTAGCATTDSTTPTTTVPSASAGPTTIGSLALGVNVSSWDPLYTGSSGASINRLIESAGVRQLRYPGGSFADEYHWSNNTDSAKCADVVTAACSRPDPLGFDNFGAQARSARATMFVTVNYGSGTPTEGAQWVAHATSVPHTGVALWEVGNESYSCYETNQHLAGSPTFIHGYTLGGSVCPTTMEMARSYAANALPYLQAMKRADPGARIGVPWAFSGAVANGAGVSDADIWNAEVLHALRPDISFVDAHWYPFDTIKGVDAPRLLNSVRRIPSAAGHIRSMLHHYAPGATFTVGETNISERPTAADFRPVSALFAAATSLEWLSAGAAGVDWWDLNNYGTPTTGDFGLLSSGSPETEPTDSPLPPYYGEVLASMLTSPGSHLRAIAATPSSLFDFESDLHGRRSVLLVNAAPNHRFVVTPTWFRHRSQIQVETYGAATSTDSEPIVGSTASSTAKVSLPAESIVVLSGTAKS